jgi:exodeoxyribonuclease VII small subunit
LSQDRPLPTARLEELLTSLETTIGELAGGTAPLEELVAAHQRALRLLSEAQSNLDELKGRAQEIARKLEHPTNKEASP